MLLGLGSGLMCSPAQAGVQAFKVISISALGPGLRRGTRKPEKTLKLEKRSRPNFQAAPLNMGQRPNTRCRKLLCAEDSASLCYRFWRLLATDLPNGIARPLN